MMNNFLDLKRNKVLNKKSFTKKDFDDIYIAMHQKVYNFVLKRVSDQDVAEDLTSDIFEKVLKSIQDFKWQGINIAAWIFRISRNRVIDHYRKYSKHKNDPSIYDLSNIIKSTDDEQEYLMIETEEYTYLYDAVREFNDLEQYIIYYKFFEGVSNKKIAKVLDMTETNVGTKLYRIRRKLASVISKLENQSKSTNDKNSNAEL